MKFGIYLLVLLVPLSLFGQLKGFENVTSTHLPPIALRATNSMDARVADLDGDGDQDILLAVEFTKNVILLNQGDGHFSDGSHLLPDPKIMSDDKPYPYYPHHDSEDVAVADFDRDGDLDLLFVTEDDQTNEYYLQQDNGSFLDATDRFPASAVTNGVISFDANGDGWEDVFLANNGQNILLFNEKGHWRNVTDTHLPKREDISQDVEAGDVDQDGDLDLIIGNERSNRLLLNDGQGRFSDETDRWIFSGNTEETREADLADVDGDGDLDLFFANVFMFQQVKPVQRLFLNEGNSFREVSSEAFSISTLAGFVDADFYDLDQDGDLDLLVTGGEGFRILFNDGQGHFSDHTIKLLSPISQMGVDVEVADFNGDGLPDIYLAHFRAGDVLLFGK